MRKKHLVLIGGGHAHLLTLARVHRFIAKGFGVTVIQPSEYHYYSGMGPGMLGGSYPPEAIRFNTRKTVEAQGGTFIKGVAVRIDSKQRLVFVDTQQQPIAYDLLSCNTGSQVVTDSISPDNQSIFAVKPIATLQSLHKRLLDLDSSQPVEVAVIGSGPSAVEIAGNIWRLGSKHSQHQPLIRIFSGNGLLASAPPGVRKRIQASLVRRNIEIMVGHRVQQAQPGTLVLDNGQEYAADIIVAATGVRPSSLFADSGLSTGPDGGLRVNRFLQSTDAPDIFAGGDCIYFEAQPLDKIGVYAVKQNPILYHNLLAALEQRPLQRFKPQKSYLQIYNLGDHTGLFCRRPLIFGGRLAFRIKDAIDRKFMQSYRS